MERKKDDQDTDKARQGIRRGKQVDIDGIQITGDPGSRAVISGSSTQATNVAGGPATGNVYLVAGGQSKSPDWIRKAIEEQHLEAGQRKHLLQTFEDILAEVEKGEKADVALVNYLLSIVSEYSPAIARLLAEWMQKQPGAPKSLAR